MLLPVFIHQDNGHYVATLSDEPDMRVIAESRELALSEMQRMLLARTEKKFVRLRDEWKKKRGPDSSPAKLTAHPAYLKIIGLGTRAVPYLLRELQTDPDLWFAALRAITEADPVANEIRGNVGAMATAWLTWAKDHGYEW